MTTNRPGESIPIDPHASAAVPWWYDSPVWEERTWATDYIRKESGIRLRVDKVRSLQVPGKIPVVTNHHPTQLQYDFSVITTPQPPPANVVEVWQRITTHFATPDASLPKGKDGSVQAVQTNAWLSWNDYRILYRYLNSVMTIDGDEARWVHIAQGEMPVKGDYEHLVMLGQLFGTSFTLAQLYGSICFRFGHREGALVPLGNNEWSHQKYIRRIVSMEDLAHELAELSAHLAPAPHYPLPSPGVFSRGVTAVLASQYPSFSTAELGAMQGYMAGIMYMYQTAYPTFTSQLLVPPNKYLSLAIVRNWATFMGAEAFQKKDYATLQRQWGPPKNDTIDKVTVKLEQRNVLGWWFKPYPTPEQVEDMKAFDHLFSSGDQAVVDIGWVDKIDSFFKRLEQHPIPTAYNVTLVKSQLSHSSTNASAMIWFTNLCSTYYPYVKYVKDKTAGWTEEGAWNDAGLTKKEQDRVNKGQSPFTSTDIAAKWPNPEKLTEDEFCDYLAAHVNTKKIYKEGKPFVETPAIMPHDKVGIFADNVEYNKAVKESDTNFLLWCQTMYSHRAILNKHPIGTSKVVVVEMDDGKKESTELYNWYPDFGVWDDHASPTQQYIQAFWSPFKALTGKTLFGWYIDTWKKLFTLALKLFGVLVERLGQLLRDFASNVWPLVAMVVAVGGVAVLGIREIGRLK